MRLGVSVIGISVKIVPVKSQLEITCSPGKMLHFLRKLGNRTLEGIKNPIAGRQWDKLMTCLSMKILFSFIFRGVFFSRFCFIFSLSRCIGLCAGRL